MGGYNVDKNAGLIIGDGDFSVIGGTLDITENGVYDVTTYKNVDVDYNVKNEDVTVTPELYEQEITPSAGYDGLGVVRVESRPINLQSKQVAPSELTTFVTADVGYDGLSSVTVDNVNASIDSDIQPENIKEGVDILGVEGTYNPFPYDSDAGIYFIDNNEEGYPETVLVENWDGGNTNLSFATDITKLRGNIRKLIFKNCKDISNISTNFQTSAFLEEIELSGVKALKTNSMFSSCPNLRKVSIKDTLEELGGSYTLSGSSLLKEVILPESLVVIGEYCFNRCYGLEEITLPSSLTSIDVCAFDNCARLNKINLPNSLTSIGGNAFRGCTSLTGLTLAQGFNCNGLNVSASTHYSVETIVACLEALADRTGQTAYTITFGTTNLNKLTTEEKAIAINKNWNLN